jgi:serine/threonine protein kinase/Tfp pilus assembly protein PilF
MKCPKCQAENPESTKFCGECGTKLIPPVEAQPSFTKTIDNPQEELTTGSIFAKRYQVIEELGKGGMGKVYKVFDKEINAKIALKLIKPEIAADQRTIERFRNELKTARDISHKNVCRMYDIGKDGNAYFITMEYIEGQDLKGLIRQSGQLTVGTSISIGAQICEGLAEAHKKGIVHRDLKPSNIMIDKQGNARIMDFGIARSVEAKKITGAGVMIGTPEYMSPEQVEGKDTDTRSDIYSLGIILYEMTTGRLPFEGDTPFSVGVKQKSETAADPRSLNPQIPEDLGQVILKCLEKDKDQRFPSAGALQSEIEKIGQSLPTTTGVALPKKPLTSKEITVTIGVRKLVFPALIALGLFAVVFLAWKILAKREVITAHSDKPSIAVLYFQNNTGDASLDHWRRALSDLLVTDLTQSKYLKVLSSEEMSNVLKATDTEGRESYSASDLREIAQRGAVEYVLVGRYAKAGDTFRVDITIQKPGEGETIASERVEGSGDRSLFPMVDELTRKIKEDLNFSPETIADDIDEEVQHITTGSPEALKYYILGSEVFDRGDFQKGIEAWKKAVEIDPEFATAYRSMAVAYGNMGYLKEEKTYLDKAYQYRDRVSERERLRIEAHYFRYSEKTWDKAVQAYQNLLSLYPDESGANTNYGILLFMMDEYDKALKVFEKTIYPRDSYYSYFWRANIWMALGDYDQSQKILESYLDGIADHAIIRWCLAGNYLCQRKYDLAVAEIDKSLSMLPSHFVRQAKGDIFACKGDLEAAEVQYRSLLEMKEPIALSYGYESLGFLEITKGRFKAAQDFLRMALQSAEEIEEDEEIFFIKSALAYVQIRSGMMDDAFSQIEKVIEDAEEAGSYGNQIAALYWKGWAALADDMPGKARQAAEDLKKVVEEGVNPRLIRYYHNLIGLIELEKGNHARALRSLQTAAGMMFSETSFWPSDQALFMEPLADVFFISGDLDRAQDEYEKIRRLTMGRLRFGDIYAKSFYMTGRIFEQQGR